MEEVSFNKISADVISELAKATAKSVFDKIKSKYTDFVKKGVVDFGIAFEKYLTESEKTISMSKTILYGQTPHHLYSFFECMGISKGNKIIDTTNVNNILSLGHKLIITGTGGIGKSMLMKHCFLDAIKNTEFIPILIELRGLNEYSLENISIEDYLYKSVCTFGFKLEKEYFTYSLETGCYLLLFDGYDEVKNSLSAKITQEIMDLSNKYPDNYMIISSRPLEEFVGWSDFSEYSSMRLTKKQALSLISKLEYDQELKEKFLKNLDEELYDKYESFASNPLLLTIMLMTFENRLSIPDSRTDFYEQAFSTLFHRHDARKKGKYKREILSKLGYEDFKKVFSYFCFKSFFNNQYEFTEKSVLDNISRAKQKIRCKEEFEDTDYLKDMTNSVCVLIHEGLNYRFSHRSFQEYFAALYTTQLSDDEQKRFVTSWLKTYSSRITSDYLDILRELQPDRFFKNILYHPLCELKNMYEENGSSNEWFLAFLYHGMSVRKDKNKDYNFFVTIENSYYHTIVLSMLKYVNYSFNSDLNKNVEGLNDIGEILREKYGLNHTVSFEELKRDGLYDQAIKCISWVLTRKDYIFNYIDESSINTLNRKRTFESMLEEL